MKDLKVLRGLVVLALVSGLVAASFAQNPAQQLQTQQQQQQMLRLQTMTQMMNKVMEKAQNMVRTLEQKMTNVPETATLAREQHRYLINMGEAIGKAAESMSANIEALKAMAQNRELAQNRAITQEMNQLQTRTEKVAGEMQEMLKIMERLSNRIQVGK
jgi:Na+-transporting NADH:ubiquinone oxidoreductase subunit NqrC